RGARIDDHAVSVDPLVLVVGFSILVLRLPPRSPLFPYTTLFRSSWTPAPLPSSTTSMSSCWIPVSKRAGAFLHDLRFWPCIQTRSEEHTSELQSRFELVCRLLLEKKKSTH